MRTPFVATAALLAVLFTAAAAASPPDELTLDNGLRVLLFPHPGSGLVASNVFVGAGSTREVDRYAGSSHFLEHVLFNGTSRLTQEELYAATDRIGAYNNATTKREYTHYMMVAPAERLAEALDIQAGMLFHSTLPPEKFEKERGIVLEELGKDKDDPDYAIERALDELLYGAGSDFARPVLGTAETIENLPREDVVAYYRRQYVPANMRLVLMGDFDRAEALDLVRREFRLEEPVDSEPPLATEAPLPGPPCILAAPGNAVSRPVEAPRVVLDAVVSLPEGTPADDAGLALLAWIAGGTKSSRIESALGREPAIAHDDASASFGYVGNGRQLSVRVRLSEGADPREGATRILALLESLSTVEEAELEAARTALLAQEVSQLEQLHYYALFQGDRLWHSPEGYTGSYLAALEAADLDLLRAAAARLREEGKTEIAAAGPGLTEASMDLAELAPAPELVGSLAPSAAATPAPLHRSVPAPLAQDEPAEVFTLENGITVIHRASSGTRMFALHLLVRNRSLREPHGLHGIADLLHRTMAARVERPTEAGPSRAARIGAEIKVADNPWIPYDDYYTSPLYSFVRLECIDSFYREGLGLLAEMLAGPHDDPAAIEAARKEMMSALSRAGDRPSTKSRSRFRELLYPGHPLADPVMGNAETLAGIAPADVAAFAPEYLSPDELVLAVVGDVSRREVREALDETLGRLPPVESGEDDPAPEGPPPPPLTGSSASEEIPGDGNQASLRMGRVMKVDPADRWALLAAVLVASDRMQQDLRETRGLAYSLGISIDFQGGRAVLAASMGTRPENLEEAKEGMLSYVAGGGLEVSADELETAVNGYVSRMRMRQVTSLGQAFTLSRDLFLHDSIEYSRREAEGLAAVTPADVRRASEKYLGKGEMVTVVAR